MGLARRALAGRVVRGGRPGGGVKGGAVKGGGAEKGAGGPTTAERTESFQQLQGDYPLGSLVEIEQRDDGFQGAWFEAPLKKYFPQKPCFFLSRSHSNLPQMSHSPSLSDIYERNLFLLFRGVGHRPRVP